MSGSQRDTVRLYISRLREYIESRGNDTRFSFVLVELPFVAGAALLAVMLGLLLFVLIVGALASPGDGDEFVYVQYSVSGAASGLEVETVPVRVEVVKAETMGGFAALLGLLLLWLVAASVGFTL